MNLMFLFPYRTASFRTAACAALLFALCFSTFVSFSPAQTPDPTPPVTQGMGGSVSVGSERTASTGAARSYTSRRTVGITDANAPVVFEDVTQRTALARFKHISGGREKDYILETVSGGVAIFDYDNDGRMDIYLLNGSTFAALRGQAKAPRAALYRNLGNWQFEDVTDKAGVGNERWGMGVCTGDYDNDGDSDIYIGNFGVSRLYRNNGDGTFTDVAEKLGVARKGWSTGATFGDYDRDGRLDLFVPGYVELDLNNLPVSPADVARAGRTSINFCEFRGVAVACGPRGLRGATDTLYRQRPDGGFEDVSARAGVTDTDRYYGFASAFIHADDDDLLDLLVVNDSTPKQLYINKGDGTFDESGYVSGIGLNADGREQAGMGLGFGDYDNDGRVDFYVTNFSDDTNTLYHNDGGGQFTDMTVQAGHGDVTLPFLGWGTSFLDYDNDGWRDLLVANGHIYPGVDEHQWGTSYAQQMLLFRNLTTGRFERVGAAPKSGLAAALSARGLAVGDLDDDGRLDVVVNNIDATPTVLRNVNATTNHWLRLRLIGDPTKRVPRDATGAIVYATTGRIRQRFDVVSGAGYGSQNDVRIHFGLGTANAIDKLVIKWSNGMTEVVTVPGIDRTLTITQGKGIIK